MTREAIEKEKHDRLITNLKENCKPLILSALEDPSVVEIMLNPDRKLWIERIGQPMELYGSVAPEKSRMIINLVAGSLSTTVTLQEPIVEGELALDGSRFEGLAPPVVSNHTFTIRKKASKIFTLEDYVHDGIMGASALPILYNAVEHKDNIIVAGGTGSGKTTLVNAVIDCIARLCPNDRLIIIEDTAELQSKSQNVVFLRTTDSMDTQRLVKVTMRLRPTRIIIGEVRDGTALDLLKAWNTGHPGGVGTVHANSADETLGRLQELVAEATPAEKQDFISKAIQTIIFIKRSESGRVVSEIIKVKGFNAINKQYETEMLYAA